MCRSRLRTLCVWASLGVGAAVLSAAPIAAQSDGEPLGKDDFELVEKIDPVWPVAGEVVVGVMATWQDPREGEPLLTILSGPRPELAELCVKVVSRSGEYEASAEIPLGSDIADPVRVDWADASEHKDKVEALKTTDVAVRAAEGSCDDADAPFLLASWGGIADGEPDSIVVLVNAKTSAANLLLSAGGSWNKETECEKVSDPRRLGYDFVCELELDGPLPDVDRLQGIVLRKQFGGAKPPELFTISLRDPE